MIADTAGWRGQAKETDRQMSSGHEYVNFRSGELLLEGVVYAGGECGGVICHPHPQYGGDMNNSVVRAIEDAMRGMGMTTLRFNFRGVGESGGNFDHGRGELQDAQSAIAVLAARGCGPIVLAGYSFGAMMALHAGAADEQVERVIAVAPPLALMPYPSEMRAVPQLIVVGARDGFCPPGTAERAATGRSGIEVRTIDGADHFFGAQIPELRDAIAAHLASNGCTDSIAKAKR